MTPRTEVTREGTAGADRDSQVNACRIAAVIDRLATQFRSMAQIESVEFFNLCLSLARGIDFAVANQEIPSRAQDLPVLLKQVCKSKNDSQLLTAIMVLMISVKNACQRKWFSDRDSEELCGLANQIGRCFCSSMDFSTEPTSSRITISTIMTRFYPRLKMGEILMYLEAKPGFDAYVKDFQISKQISRHEKIKLLVAQTDNTETSLCLVSPQDANFLLNGKGVDRRTNVFMDTGPQMPTNVNHFLKYGTNLLQAVGQFNGNYIIVIAVISELPTMDNPVLQDYVQPAATVVDKDSELIEGPSRISLNCPISFKRIKTPVKGHSCKHLQCFDFDNYMDINSKRPSWRCPHCNHHVCFTDIRIDQNMVKVLKDVGKNVNGVIISADGSWKSVMESDDHTEKEQDKYSLVEVNGSEETGIAVSNTSPDFMDLTGADDVFMVDAGDRKLVPNNSEAQGISENVTSSLLTRSELNQNISLQLEDTFWTGIYLSTFGSSSSMPDQVNGGGIPETSSTNALLSPVLADATSPTPEAGISHANALVSVSGPQNEISSQSALALRPSPFGNSSNSSEYGSSVSTALYMNRTPVAVQALPAQAPSTVPNRPRHIPNDLLQTIPLGTGQTSAPSFSRTNERPQLFTRPHDSFQASKVASPSLQQPLYSQQQERQFSSVMPHQVTGRQTSTHVHPSYPSQLRSNMRLPLSMPRNPPPSSGIPSSQTLNLRMKQTVNQSTGMLQPPVKSLNPQAQHGGGSQGLPSITIGGISGQQARAIAAAQRPPQVTRPPRIPSFPVNNSEGNRVVGDQGGTTATMMTQSANRLDASGTTAASPTDPAWRPPGRMRGSLSGPAYDALIPQIIQPTQTTTTAAAATSATIPPNASTQLQILLANRAAFQAVGNNTNLSNVSGGSGALPPGPSERN